jgi:hypothetical protein
MQSVKSRHLTAWGRATLPSRSTVDWKTTLPSSFRWTNENGGWELWSVDPRGNPGANSPLGGSRPAYAAGFIRQYERYEGSPRWIPV